LQLLGHRYYDSSTGTFITRDPIKDGRNWYSYCENNPVTLVDAEGLSGGQAERPAARGVAKGKVRKETLEKLRKDKRFRERVHREIGKRKKGKKVGKPDQRGRTNNQDLTDQEIWDILNELDPKTLPKAVPTTQYDYPIGPGLPPCPFLRPPLPDYIWNNPNPHPMTDLERMLRDYQGSNGKGIIIISGPAAIPGVIGRFLGPLLRWF
jgi:uncharacterized protein RhaS with RHS repeats